MALNFSSVISNTKGAANIAKLKVTLGLKTNELNRVYAELGKAFYDRTQNNQTKELLSAEIQNSEASAIDYLTDETMGECFANIRRLQQEIATLEEQVSDERDNMQPLDVSNASVSYENGHPNDTQPTEPAVKCPKCGMMQGPDNDFCVYCGAKITE